MYKKQILILAFILLSFSGSHVFAQRNWSNLHLERAKSVDTLKKGPYTLVFVDHSPDLDAQVKSRLEGVFFKNYRKLAKHYNKNTTKEVIIVIDPEFKGVAAASNGIVRISPEWLKKNPGDIDVVTHEIMHLVQSYPGGAGPGWITEGVADYVRFKYGVDNEGGNWRLPEFDPSSSYENSYRITARFFHWLEKNTKKGIVKNLDQAMRSKSYSEDFWVKQTDRTLDELWEEYAENPSL